MEPILELAAIEQDLQGPNGDAERAKAKKIEALALGVAGLVDEHKDADERNDADRQIDVEHPAPVVIVGQPTAERGADDRADHGTGPPYRHRLAMPLGRIDAQEDGLRQRHQGCTTDPLQQAKEDDLGEAFGKPAQYRRRGKADDRNQKDTFDAESPGQPAGQRRHDGGGDDIGGQDPGDLVLRRGEAALDVRQRNVGDRRIDRLHNRRQHDRDCDGGAIDLRGNKITRSASTGLDAPREPAETLGLATRGDISAGRNGITHFAVATMMRGTTGTPARSRYRRPIIRVRRPQADSSRGTARAAFPRRLPF